MEFLISAVGFQINDLITFKRWSSLLRLCPSSLFAITMPFFLSKDGNNILGKMFLKWTTLPVQCFLVLIFLLTYWTKSSPGLGTTETDNHKLSLPPYGSLTRMDRSIFWDLRTSLSTWVVPLPVKGCTPFLAHELLHSLLKTHLPELQLLL